jgi:hypothetical protein
MASKRKPRAVRAVYKLDHVVVTGFTSASEMWDVAFSGRVPRTLIVPVRKRKGGKGHG